MITKIWLQEYGPFRQAEFSLAPLTVLVGPNASGKTKAMEALYRIQRAVDENGKLDDDFDEEAHDEIARDFFRSLGRAGATLRPFIGFEAGSGGSFFFSELDESGPPIEESQLVTRQDLPSMRLLRFDPDTLKSASYLEADELTIQRDGYGLATVLADMKLQDDERLEWIQGLVRTIIPNFQRIRFRRVEVANGQGGNVAGQELIFDVKNAPGLSPDAVSDGTVLVLGTICSIAETRHRTTGAPVLVLIDEIERGLHPRALGDLIGCLRRMTEEVPVQILATSHSPYLLDSLEPEEVRLTGFLEDGTATICELSDHPDFKRWKDVMTPGEFWSTAGEDWIRDVRK
jgi:predicted ATPase